MFLENSFIAKNTPVHRLNPVVKFLIFIPIVFLLFMKISFLIQTALFLFACLVIWKSDSLNMCKKITGVYFIILLFLYVVNFFFLKTPGFWCESQIASFRDIFGSKTISGSLSHDKLEHGWFVGGEILRKKDNSIWFDESTKCLDKYMQFPSGECSDDKFDEGFLNLTNFKNWRIFPVESGGKMKYVAFAPKWYTVSSYQFINSFALANKIILIILLSAIFTRTISLGLFSYALEDLFRPLKFFKLPNKIMALAVAISIRFVPSLITESFRIIRAQSSRGIDYKNGRFKDKVVALLSLFVPLFVISFIKAGELSEAMMARGYDNYHPRNEYKVCIIRPWEMFVLFFSMSFITCLYYFFFNSFCIGFLMDMEILSLIAR